MSCMSSSCVSSLLISELLAGYRARLFSPVEIIEQLLDARGAQPDRHEWIALLPAASAPVVERLIAAGAIPIGKTRLDQFATGLAGVRSPVGACRNSIDPRFISGGSSSGSAVAVATGQVSFALATDTAGSVRV